MAASSTFVYYGKRSFTNDSGGFLFLQARCTSCHPTESVKALKRPWTTNSKPGKSPTTPGLSWSIKWLLSVLSTARDFARCVLKHSWQHRLTTLYRSFHSSSGWSLDCKWLTRYSTMFHATEASRCWQTAHLHHSVDHALPNTDHRDESFLHVLSDKNKQTHIQSFCVKLALFSGWSASFGTEPLRQLERVSFAVYRRDALHVIQPSAKALKRIQSRDQLVSLYFEPPTDIGGNRTASLCCVPFNA